MTVFGFDPGGGDTPAAVGENTKPAGRGGPMSVASPIGTCPKNGLVGSGRYFSSFGMMTCIRGRLGFLMTLRFFCSHCIKPCL